MICVLRNKKGDYRQDAEQHLHWYFTSSVISDVSMAVIHTLQKLTDGLINKLLLSTNKLIHPNRVDNLKAD